MAPPLRLLLGRAALADEMGYHRRDGEVDGIRVGLESAVHPPELGLRLEQDGPDSATSLRPG